MQPEQPGDRVREPTTLLHQTFTPAQKALRVLLRDGRDPHRRHRVPVAAVPGPERPVRLRLLPAPNHLEAGRIADHNLQLLDLETPGKPETFVARLVDQHHADVAAGRRGPLPRTAELRQQFANVMRIQPVKAGPRRVGRIPNTEDPAAVANFQRRVNRGSVPGEGGE